MKRRDLILDVLALTGCVAFSIFESVNVIASWWGGKSGEVILLYNTVHERLIETIVIIILAIISISWFGYKFIKKLWESKNE